MAIPFKVFSRADRHMWLGVQDSFYIAYGIDVVE